MNIPSIEERLSKATQTLALVIGALNADCDHSPVISDEIVKGAAADAVSEAYEELYWLTRLPPSVLNMAAPTDDQREHEKRAKRGPAR